MLPPGSLPFVAPGALRRRPGGTQRTQHEHEEHEAERGEAEARGERTAVDPEPHPVATRRKRDTEARDQVREIAADRNFGQTVRLYELADRAREVEFATRVIPAPQMNACLLYTSDAADE